MILSPITFPGLGISVDPPRIAFTACGKGPSTGTASSSPAGFLLAVLYGLKRRCKAVRVCGRTTSWTCCSVADTAGAHRLRPGLLLHFLLGPVCRDNPISCLYIWDGEPWPSTAASSARRIGVLVISAVERKLPAGDDPGHRQRSASSSARAIGRWGNFINREAHGCGDRQLPAHGPDRRGGSRCLLSPDLFV